MIFKFAFCVLMFSYLTAANNPHCDGTVRYIEGDDWQDILSGKWVVKFYASWCPACRSFKSDWEELAKKFHNEGFCLASADVSLNAGLSGRFFVTSLPTFYLIQDGEIRMYNGVRSKDGLTQFVLEGAWKDTPTVPWYISPTSYHMATLGAFFRFSMAVRNFHTHITEHWGVPSWISYIAFALLTIFIGLLFGLFVVFLCDMGLGPASPSERKKRVDPFGMEPSIEDMEEDVVDDKGDVVGDDEQVEEGDDDDDNEEVVGDDDDDGEEAGGDDDDEDSEELEGEADDEEEEGGRGEPRRRKKTTLDKDGGGNDDEVYADDDDDDDKKK